MPARNTAATPCPKRIKKPKEPLCVPYADGKWPQVISATANYTITANCNKQQRSKYGHNCDPTQQSIDTLIHKIFIQYYYTLV